MQTGSRSLFHLWRRRTGACTIAGAYAGAFMALLSVIYACTPTVSLFNETAYQQAVELKVVSLDLTSHATRPFDEYRAEVSALQLELKKAYEFSNGRPDNEHTTGQWEIMLDPEGGMLGEFLRLWEESGRMSEVFMNEFRTNIALGFDTIIGLESGKIKPGD